MYHVMCMYACVYTCVSTGHVHVCMCILHDTMLTLCLFV